MAEDRDRARLFAELHRPGEPLLMPNPWDVGSAKLLAAMGFKALATTSSGFAASLGRLDGSVTREEALEHAAAVVAATDLPVSADLENGFVHDPDGVAETVRGAIEAGLAGCSIEDASGDPESPIYSFEEAVARVSAAVGAAHDGPRRLVLTARAENYVRGRPDLQDTINRLRAYADVGADVVFAPGLTTMAEIAAAVEAVPVPVNVLARPGVPPVAELARVGVARVSVGGAFAFAAAGALVEAATELREQGSYGYLERSAAGVQAVRAAFGRG